MKKRCARSSALLFCCLAALLPARANEPPARDGSPAASSADTRQRGTTGQSPDEEGGRYRSSVYEDSTPLGPGAPAASGEETGPAGARDIAR